jgi:hypothetical protein
MRVMRRFRSRCCCVSVASSVTPYLLVTSAMMVSLSPTVSPPSTM